MSKHIQVMGAAAVFAISCAAHADDQTEKTQFKLSGFGTIAAVRASTDDAEFVTTINPSRGVGRSLNLSNDSKFGLQGDWQFGPRLAATVQLLSQRNGLDNHKPRISALFLKYDLDPDLALRVGRLPFAGYAVSDYRNIGFVLPWLRPPVEVYNTLPFGDLAGADLLYRYRAASGELTVQPFIGVGKWQAYQGTGRNKIIAGANANFETGSWNFRAVYFHTKFNFHSPFIDSFYQQLEATGDSQLIAAASQTDTRDYKPAYFVGLSAAYDDGKVMFQAEAIRGIDHDLFPGYDSAYVTAGYHAGSVLPFVTYSKSYRSDTVNSKDFPKQPQYGFFQAVADSFGAGPRQDTLSLGVKWNFHANMDLKLQFDHVRTEAGAANMFVNAKPDFAGHSVNVAGVGLDFVF